MKHVGFAPGKMILSGEYAVVFGHPGIAIPSTIGVTVTYTKTTAEDLKIEWKGIQGNDMWNDYIQAIVRMCEQEAGTTYAGALQIDNQLPLGKGMGSSTAMIIAIVRCLVGNEARALAEKIEQDTYPERSGLDFAVIWEGRPVRFVKGKSIDPIELPPALLRGGILIDTGTPNETTKDLVAETVRKKDEPTTAAALLEIARCTERLLNGESPFTVFPDHHKAQVALGVVPQDVERMIADIEAQGGVAKVIGAGGKTGGGGMVLALGTQNTSGFDTYAILKL